MTPSLRSQSEFTAVYGHNLIKSIRHELTDQAFFYNANDLQQKLDVYKQYFNEHRTHMGINGKTPNDVANNSTFSVVDLNNYRWKQYCRGLVNLPIAA
jgi:putative transposase